MQQRQNIKTKISNLESEKNPKLPFFERLLVMPVGFLDSTSIIAIYDYVLIFCAHIICLLFKVLSSFLLDRIILRRPRIGINLNVLETDTRRINSGLHTLLNNVTIIQAQFLGRKKKAVILYFSWKYYC